MHDHNGVIQQNMVFSIFHSSEKRPSTDFTISWIPVFVCHDHKGIRITAEYVKLTTQMEKYCPSSAMSILQFSAPNSIPICWYWRILIIMTVPSWIPHQFVLQLQLNAASFPIPLARYLNNRLDSASTDRSLWRSPNFQGWSAVSPDGNTAPKWQSMPLRYKNRWCISPSH